MTEIEYKKKVEEAEAELFERETKPDEFKKERSELESYARNTAASAKNLEGSSIPNALELMYDERAKEIDRLLKGESLE